MKNGWKIFGIILLIIIVLYVIYYLYKNKSDTNNRISTSISDDGEEKILTYRVPTTMDSDYYSPYWDSLHHIVSEIPCSICRNDAEKRMIFFHDSINAKLGKPIFNMQNWKKYLIEMCALKDKYEKNNWQQIKNGKIHNNK